jgi:hypothetical protein
VCVIVKLVSFANQEGCKLSWRAGLLLYKPIILADIVMTCYIPFVPLEAAISSVYHCGYNIYITLYVFERQKIHFRIWIFILYPNRHMPFCFSISWKGMRKF